MSKSKVIWSEGMFLEPQHFQQQDRYFERVIDARARAISGYGWGFEALRLDETVLALGKIAIASARGVLPDGTPFDIPGTDPAPDPIDIPMELKDRTVLLAVPLRRAGGVDASLDASNVDPLSRYCVDTTEAGDNTNPGRVAILQTGQLRLRLIAATDGTDAYASLGLVHVIERRPDNQLILDKTYIPPTLSVRSSPLLASVTSEINGLLGQRGQAIAARFAQPGRGGVGEIADFLLLQTVNRFQALFAHLVEEPQLHPERLYSVCLMLAGDLSVFSRDDRRPIAFAPYRHDDLERTFTPVIVELRRALSMVLEQNAIPIEQHLRQHNVRVAIIQDRGLLRSSSFVLAVNAQLSVEMLRARFPTQVKIGPVERIRDLVNLALPGIAINSLPVAPRQIPYHAGFTYFELDRSGEHWQQLERSGGLALHLAGEFPGLALELWAIKG